MKYRIIVFFLIAALPFCAVLGQQQRQGGTVTGKITDSQSGHAIEYSNVVLFNAADSSQVTGTVTSPDGIFNLTGVRPGKYYIDVLFMGYERKRVDVSLGRGNMNADLGEIKIVPTSISLDNVVVEGQRAAFSYQIDKKVISADQINTALSGTAAEVLETLPSVTVDIEGNVSLRGSGSFTVLIDGRPTILDAQDALQQIPASSIETIEVITNPSAKYDPEGVSGIINIVMKKSKTMGISGLTNLNMGLNEKYGGDVLLEARNQDMALTFGADYNKRVSEGSTQEERRYYTSDNSFTGINTNGDSRWGRKSYGFRANMDLFLSASDVWGFGGRYGYREMEGGSTLDRFRYSNISSFPDYSFNNSDRERSGHFFSINTNYQHKFAPNGHELQGNLSYDYSSGDELTVSELLTVEGGSIQEGTKSTEDGPGKEVEFRLDYTLPLSETSKFEAGTEGDLETSDDNTGYYQYSLAEQAYILQPDYSQSTKSEDRQVSVYTIYSNTIGAFGFQGGLRSEYTYRDIKIPARNQKFNIDRWDFFPTLHFSYKFETGPQVMASYTRRIQRPRGWQLEPFDTWTDANTVRRGNPGLQPEFINSYELGAQTLFGEFSVSTEFYYRNSVNKIDGISSRYDSTVSLQTFANIGSENSVGAELLVNYDLFKFWSMDLMGNLYNYELNATVLDSAVDKSSFNWRGRVGNLIRLPGGFSFQINAFYNSPTISTQGERKGFFSADLAVRKDFLDKKLSLTMQARNLFKSSRDENITESPGYYSWSLRERESPMIMFNLKYAINNFKQKERQRENGDDYNGGDQF